MLPIPPDSACEGCSITGRLGRDHCHEHGWVRGILCNLCNGHVGRIDKRILPRIGGEILTALLAVRNRCTDCTPLRVMDLKPYKAKTNAEKQRDYRERNSQHVAALTAENAALRTPDRGTRRCACWCSTGDRAVVR